VKPIVQAPHPVLTTPTKPVVQFDAKLQKLITELSETLVHATNPKGVGLAAPQIGVASRVCVMKPKQNSRLKVLINPVILNRSRDVTDGIPDRANKLEGCLSITAVWGKVKRNATVHVRYTDEKGIAREEEFSGFPATIVQHEIDHLDGILFPQRVLEQNGELYQVTKDTDGKEVLEKISV